MRRWGKSFKNLRRKQGETNTKVTISGPKIARLFYEDATHWTRGNESRKVLKDNEHLGQRSN